MAGLAVLAADAIDLRACGAVGRRRRVVSGRREHRHLLTDGTYIDNGRSRSGAVFVEFEYGVTRRFSVAFGVPFVFARYTDDDEPPDFIPFLPRDVCRCWHSGWQDVAVTARWHLVDTFDHVLAITPSVSVVLPSHAYDYRGEAVIGRRLRQMRLAVDAGRRLDEISGTLTVNGRIAAGRPRRDRYA